MKKEALGLATILTGALALGGCAPQKEISQNPCQSEWTDNLYNKGQTIPQPKTQEGNVESNIFGTKRSQIKGESQSWETFKIFGEDYYVTKDLIAQNPLGFDLTKKDLVAIAYSPVTGKTEALPLTIYHPVQIGDATGKPHKELTIENIDLKDPKFSGCNINKNTINFADYKIETTVINKQTYLIVKPQGEINENERLPLYLIPLNEKVQLIYDPRSGKLKITSTDNYLEAYKFINEDLMTPKTTSSINKSNPKTITATTIPSKLEKKAEEVKNLDNDSITKQPLNYKEKVNYSKNLNEKLPQNYNLPQKVNYSKVQKK